MPVMRLDIDRVLRAHRSRTQVMSQANSWDLFPSPLASSPIRADHRTVCR
jgi:hypothetical protein